MHSKKNYSFGGNQIRLNIHIKDMVAVYEHFLDNSDKISSGEYNAGFENISIVDIAKKIKKKINCEILIEKSNDPRSYRQNSDKLIATGFNPKFSIDYAITEIKNAFESGLLEDKETYYTIKTMKKITGAINGN